MGLKNRIINNLLVLIGQLLESPNPWSYKASMWPPSTPIRCLPNDHPRFFEYLFRMILSLDLNPQRKYMSVWHLLEKLALLPNWLILSSRLWIDRIHRMKDDDHHCDWTLTELHNLYPSWDQPVPLVLRIIFHPGMPPARNTWRNYLRQRKKYIWKYGADDHLGWNPGSSAECNHQAGITNATTNTCSICF